MSLQIVNTAVMNLCACYHVIRITEEPCDSGCWKESFDVSQCERVSFIWLELSVKKLWF